MSRASGIPVSDFPAIERDVTLMVPQREQAGRIVRLMKEGEPFSLVDVFIADDFSKSEEDFRRVTYRLKFQSAERTLKHEEVDTSMKNLLDLLASKHGVRMAEG
jgi:phenylalanyl-tRNA synthetase beta subunit